MSEKKKFSTKQIILTLVVFAVVILAVFGIYKAASSGKDNGTKNDTQVTSQNTQNSEADSQVDTQVDTQAVIKVTIEVVDDQGEKTTYDVETKGEFLSDAMKDADGLTYDGEDGDYGLYIKTVNGLTADYNTDGAYWSILVNGEYGMYSADSQPLTEGDVYTLSYTK